MDFLKLTVNFGRTVVRRILNLCLHLQLPPPWSNVSRYVVRHARHFQTYGELESSFSLVLVIFHVFVTTHREIFSHKWHACALLVSRGYAHPRKHVGGDPGTQPHQHPLRFCAFIQSSVSRDLTICRSCIEFLPAMNYMFFKPPRFIFSRWCSHGLLLTWIAEKFSSSFLFFQCVCLCR